VQLYPIDSAQFEHAMHAWRPPDDRERRAATRQPAQRTAEQVDRRGDCGRGTFRLRSSRRWRRPMAGTSSIKGFAAFWWASG